MAATAIPTSHHLHLALHKAMDGHALNQQEARLLFDPEPGTESLAAHILGLRYLGIPGKVIAGLLDEVRQILEINVAEDHCHTHLSGLLDRLATALHDAECNNPGHQALGVKAIARVLRRPLRDLRAMDAGPVDGLAYFRAAAALRDVIASTTPDQLRARSLRHELGEQSHDRLLELLDAVPA